jgi:peptide/nickel transport system permease protein
MGLDLPLWKQYLNFLYGPDPGIGPAIGILRWPPNLGYSFQNNEPVLQTILDRLPVTASLALGGCVLWLLLGFSTGILAALRPRSLYDRGVMALAVLGSPRRCSSSAWGAVRLLLQARLGAGAGLRADL